MNSQSSTGHRNADFLTAYLLRDPTKKREVWEDTKKVVEFLKVTSPPRIDHFEPERFR